jgi:hypothetical protein
VRLDSRSARFHRLSLIKSYCVIGGIRLQRSVCDGFRTGLEKAIPTFDPADRSAERDRQMTSTHSLAIRVVFGVLSASLLHAADLTRYRSFQFGMDLPTTARLAKMEPSEAKMLHARPALIQELEWHPERYYSPSYAQDPVQSVVLGFYDGELFRMTVSYDRSRTEGVTANDMIAAISATYGPATTPDAELILDSGYSETLKVLARWEDSQYSYSLVRSPERESFSLVLVSKRLDALASAAITAAVLIEKEEAPQRERDLLKLQEEDRRLLLEKARRENKPGLRP